MLSATEFVQLTAAQLGRPLNNEQIECVEWGPQDPLLIIAGPGTGKTTVMVLRALRHLLVDRFAPEQIVITTFTKKAAQEVRTRWLEWGLPLVAAAQGHPSLQNLDDQAWLQAVDLNRCVTGTLDSICEELLEEYRPAGTVTPVLIEGYPANQRLLRAGFQVAYYANQPSMNSYLGRYTFSREPPNTLADVVKVVRPIVDRFAHDRMDVDAYGASSPDTVAKTVLKDSHALYCDDLLKNSQLDFALLEREFLSRTQQGALDEAILTWRALLVDEYQDTNPLQEAIYFEIVRRNQSSLSVVGDDDQSLYRFRGATVELFTHFVSRLAEATDRRARTAFLYRNYRSTPEIIAFFNRFISGDAAFTPARIQPPKPAIHGERPHLGLPVLGMFRPTPECLATDLAQFLHDVFRNGGRSVPMASGGTIPLVGANSDGDVGDAVYLAHSVNEFGRPSHGNPPKVRLPCLLRRELTALGISTFNPRGQALSDQPSVQILLGLILECLDRSSPIAPHGSLTPDVQGLTHVARDRLLAWRARAQVFMATDPFPHGLRGFVDAWSKCQSQSGSPWPDDWPLLELCFKLITWMPSFHDDPEHQVWLEAISRAVTQARLFSPYAGMILSKAPHDTRSRSSVIRDILRPIAEGLVDIDEDIMPHVPRDRFTLMTIHQSKGLEFPLVVVDISSGFATNHRMTAGQRFPSDPSGVAQTEDDLAPFSSVGASRTARSAMDRTFDDLARLYYVAYSRPQTALLLVGLEKTIATGSTVKNVASGWTRDGAWSWHDPRGARTTFANQLPLVLV